MLQWFFLESTIALGIVSFLVLFWLLVHWRRNGNVRPLLIGLLVCGTLLIIQAAVVTPRERAELVLGKIERDVKQGKTTALAESLGRQFTGLGVGRTEFIDAASRYVGHMSIHALYRSELRTEPAGDGFVAVVSYLAEMGYDSESGTVITQWRFRFAREDGRWVIVELPEATIERQRITRLTEIRPP